MGGIEIGQQMPTFIVGSCPHVKVISSTPRDASAIIDLLQAQESGDAVAVARQDRDRHSAEESAEVDLGIGEVGEVLAVLDELRVQRNPLGQTLTRLANALTDKIQAES